MSKSTIQQHLQLVASQMGASNNVTAGAATDAVRKAVSGALKKVSKKVAPDSKATKALKSLKDSKAVTKAKEAASAVKQHFARNGKKYAIGAGVGAAVGASAYGANKLRSNEITAGVVGTVTNAVKNAGKSLKAGYVSGRKGLEYEGKDKLFKTALHVGKNRNKYLAGAGIGAGVGAATVGYKAYNKDNQVAANEVSAMEYFMNITAAEYLEVKTNGTIANNVTAADYAEYNKMSAMEFLIKANEDSAELAEASDDIQEALANADTEEEVAEILDANNLVKDAHAEKADELAEIADSDSEDADEAAALAEFHAGKAQEAEDVENDVVSALYYNN